MILKPASNSAAIRLRPHNLLFRERQIVRASASGNRTAFYFHAFSFCSYAHRLLCNVSFFLIDPTAALKSRAIGGHPSAKSLKIFCLFCFSINSLQKELDVQEEKKERADKLVRKIKREVKGSGNKKLAEFTAGEEDIKVRELRDFNNSLMKKLGIVCRDCPDIAPILNMYCQQVGLPQPPSPGPTSGSSSRASSIASSASSVRSNLSSAR